MAEINKQRMTAVLDGDFVVFLIGMRVNSFWKFHKWIPVAAAMPKMLRELSNNPESGFLGYQLSGGLPPISIQYWRSFEHLEAYAKNKNAEHFPAWVDFNNKVRKSGAVGIWHETYIVREGDYENIYSNMPKFGLGKVGELIPASGKLEGARERFRNRIKK